MDNRRELGLGQGVSSAMTEHWLVHLRWPCFAALGAEAPFSTLSAPDLQSEIDATRGQARDELTVSSSACNDVMFWMCRC